LKAAENGSAEAHFAIAYRYVVTHEESIYHFSEAAKKGHEEALGYALEKLLFRANSLKLADPNMALAIYYAAKKENPDLYLYDEKEKVRVMKMCVDPKGFDASSFLKKYEVLDEDGQYPFYDIWELAEEASRGGRFGKPDPELLLNLVIRGANVPAELESAVNEVYNNWKNNVIKEFNICNHITSGMGQGYCASRENDKEAIKRRAVLKEIKRKLGTDYIKLVDKSYKSAAKFIETKAIYEEGHGGSGRSAWIIGSKMAQKSNYLELIDNVLKGFIPENHNSYKESDLLLNKIYKKVIKKLKSKKEDEQYPFTYQDIRKVQRLWIPYRDLSSQLYNKISDSVEEEEWKTWLTNKRITELKTVLEWEAY